jgi:biotin carboxyl carrier protein
MSAVDSSSGGGAIRVTVGPTSRHDDDPTVVVGLGDAGAPGDPGEAGRPGDAKDLLIDGTPTRVRWISHDASHATIAIGADGAEPSTRLLLGATHRRERDGVVLREVVVDGWRIEVELEAESRAVLRERARRAGAATVAGGPAEVHAIIPGRIVAVSVVPGDMVVAGQQLLVLEAMKMQNELRAPREGSVELVAVSVGDTVDIGDLLLVIR